MLTVRAGRGAAVGVVAEGVDVHATLGVGIMAGDVPGDGGGRGLGVLLKDNSALDVRVTAENTDWQAMTLARGRTAQLVGLSGCATLRIGRGKARKRAHSPHPPGGKAGRETP